ncbi:hypothetical protein G6F65_018275 [Rhizopus arrhizus]|nr:hypothetical protein G6F65_018275 [Rhizopus arrhizus]
MWSCLKRFLNGPPPPEDPLRETVRFDDAGLTRESELARAMGIQEFWPWSDIHEFGFVFTQAMYPDPWFGDYMESLWFVRVPTDGGGLMRMDLDERVLDIDHLPPALLRNLPGRVLAWGLRAAILPLRLARGPNDALTRECAELLLKPSPTHVRLAADLQREPGNPPATGVLLGGGRAGGDPLGELTRAFALVDAVQPIRDRLRPSGVRGWRGAHPRGALLHDVQAHVGLAARSHFGGVVALPVVLDRQREVAFVVD